MKLYHFTRAVHLPSIMERGLTPRVGEDAPLLTLGKPAVWLTSNLEPGWAKKSYDDARRLTVDVTPQRLHHWLTWMGSKPAGVDILAELQRDPDCARVWADCENYYLYFGTINPKLIIGDAASVAWDRTAPKAA